MDLEPSLVTLDENAYRAEEEKHCSKHKQSTKYRRCHNCRIHDEASPQLHNTSKISIWISKDFRAIADGSYNHASAGAAAAFPQIRIATGAWNQLQHYKTMKLARVNRLSASCATVESLLASIDSFTPKMTLAIGKPYTLRSYTAIIHHLVEGHPCTYWT